MSTETLGLQQTLRYDEDLPKELLLSIQRVLEVRAGPDSDPLDTPPSDFNPIPLLNKFFPDESALGQIEAVQARLAQNSQDIQNEIDQLTAQLKSNQDPNRMQLIQEMISELLGQMSRIQEKASESEAIVKDITKDIQVLDLAKNNLILSMTSLKRLQMLVNAISQLELLIKDNKYSEIAETLAAVKQLSISFKSYVGVPTIGQFWRRIQELQGEIRTKIDADFDAFYLQTPSPSRPLSSNTIHAACLAADVLGPEVRGHMIDRYVSFELKEYRRIFRPTDEAGQLDNIGRRFAWFRRMLGRHESEMENDGEGKRVFPEDWRVGWTLFAKFSEITREDLSVVLSKMGSSLTVQALLDTLQQTIEFESSICRKYATSLPDLLKADNFETHSGARVTKPITSSFEEHMGVFIEAQDKALSDMLAPHRGKISRTSTEARRSTDSPTPNSQDDDSSPIMVLPSSTELIYFYGQTLELCSSFGHVGTGKALLDLCGVLKKWLKVYAEEVLLATLKRPIVQYQTRKSIESRFDTNHLRNACLAINTADYCQTTASELEDKIKEKIADAFKDRITLSDERELFVNAISVAITTLLKELELASEPAFTSISRTPWAQQSIVSGPSSHIEALVQSAEMVIELVKGRLEQKKYLRNFLDKGANLILVKFTHALVKSRPLRETGAEQLIIDLQAVKACLLKVAGESLTSQSYVRNISKSTQQLESLLKVIVTHSDPAEGFILNYTLLIGDASFSNFQKILDLKGTPKTDQNALLDSFLTITSTKKELATSSFLSSLDMDPSAGPVAAVPQGGSGMSILGQAQGGDGIFGTMNSPISPQPPIDGAAGKAEQGEKKREVFSDFRRFVSFAVRREKSQGDSVS